MHIDETAVLWTVVWLFPHIEHRNRTMDAAFVVFAVPGRSVDPLPGMSKDLPRRRIGELLVEQEVVSASHLSEALNAQKERGTKIIETLIALGYLDVQTFLNFLSRQPGVASIDLGNYEIPRELIKVIPREFAVKHEVFPIDKMGRYLTVGMVCPIDAATIEQLEGVTGLKVRPLLCSAIDIHSAIRFYYPNETTDEYQTDRYQAEKYQAEEHVYVSAAVTPAVLHRVESALKLETISSLIHQVTSLPPLPDTVRRVREAMENPDTSMEYIAKVVGVDPPLTAKFLSLANSPVYGFADRVTSVHAAISLLGLRQIYAVVLAGSAEAFFDNTPHFDHRAFWAHSRFCAAVSEFIAQYYALSSKTSMYASGLLHDIGRLVMARIAPERYSKIDPSLRWNEFVDAEKKQFMIAHSEIGFLLAEAWHLPKEISDVIRFHHEPHLAIGSEIPVAIVTLANAIDIYCPNTYSEDNEEFQEAARPALDILKINTDTLPELYAGLKRLPSTAE